jgi:Cft2 family RNA processing exonuclease
MMSEKTAAHDLALRMIGDERQAIFSSAMRIPIHPAAAKGGQPGEKFLFSSVAGEVTRRCEVQDFDLTAHANREDLLDLSGRWTRAVLLGHGEEKARIWFEEQIAQRYPKIKVVQPQPGLSVEV